MSRKKSILTFLGSFGVTLGQGTAGYSGYSNFNIPNNKITTQSNNKITIATNSAGNNDVIANESSRMKITDNRASVDKMLKKLLKVNGSSVTSYDILTSGCWCQLLSDDFDGTQHGDPVNVLDAACRRWSKCNQCTTIDNIKCNGIETVYPEPSYNSKEKSFSCSSKKNTCADYSCQCDLALAKELADLSNEYDSSFNMAYGFDHTKDCPSTGGAGGGKKEIDDCCGEYPMRFPYSTEDGKRGCCSGKTFDAQNLLCCPDGSISFECNSGYRQTSLCEPNPCENNGSCDIDEFQLPFCTCPDTFTGKYCETEKIIIDPCNGHQCNPAGAICVADGESYSCDCGDSGYTGDLCDISPCDTFNCGDHGSCSVTNGFATCECNAGYFGDKCEMSPCDTQNCSDNGVCSVTDTGVAKCDCSGGFSGDNCYINPCDPSPCGSKGTCALDERNFARCDCEIGWFGDKCDSNYCASVTCQNGGSCISERSGARCKCENHYTGDFCEEMDAFPHAYKTSDCAARPLELIFVIDVSGSLRSSNDFFRAAKEWIIDFVDYFDIENAVKTSIVTFSNEAKLVMPLKKNPMTRITNRLANLYAQREQESALNDALKMVNGLLDAESESGKAVIVMSDFWSTEGEFPNKISIRLAKKGAAVFSIGLGDGMMHLFAKLTALSVVDNMYLAALPEEIANHTEDIRSKICSGGPEKMTKFAETWFEPKLFTDPEDTKRISLKYDTEGKLPSLSRSDKQFIEEANFETTQIRSLKIS